jgi:hypothetical protein
LLETQFGEFVATQRHREGYPLGGFWSTDVQRDAAGVPILTASGAATPVTCVWNKADPTKVCNEKYVGPALPTRTLGLTNTFRILNNLQVYAFAEYQGGHYQWCAICSVRTRLDLNTAIINDPRLFVGHPEYQSWGRYERARLLSLQTVDFIYPADFIKLREVSATYTIPSRFSSRAGFSRAAVTVSGRNLAMWTKYDAIDDGGSQDPEVNFTSTSNFNSTDYGAIPMQRQVRVSFNFNF